MHCRFKSSLLIFAACISTVRAGSNFPFTVQNTVFLIEDEATAISLLAQRPEDDASLYMKLVRMVGDGSAKLASNSLLRGATGMRTSARFTRDQPYPKDFQSTDRAAAWYPYFFERREGGLEFSFKADPAESTGKGGAGISGTFDSQWDDGSKLERWPVSLVDGNERGHVEFPLFYRSWCEGGYFSSSTAPHLVSLMQNPVTPGGYILTFIRTNPVPPSETPQRPVPSPLLRLQCHTFHTNFAFGRQLLLNRSTLDDHLILDALMKAVKTGEVEIKFLTIGNLDPRKHEARYYTRSHREFVWPTEYDDEFLPVSLEINDFGHAISAQTVRPHSSPHSSITIEVNHALKPGMTTWPDTVAKDTPTIHQPAFYRSSISTSLVAPTNGVYCLGAFRLPDYYGADRPQRALMEISLLKVTGGTEPMQSAAAGTWRNSEIQCELISLPEQEATDLASLMDHPEDARTSLEDRLKSGTARVLAFGLLLNPAGKDAGLSVLAELPFPKESKWTARNHLLPTKIHFQNTGTFIDGKGSLNCWSDIAPFALAVATKSLIEAAITGGKIKTGAGGKWESSWQLDGSAFEIRTPEKIKVPAGHPEEGRWRVSVIRRR